MAGPAALALAIDEALTLDQDARAAFARRARAQVASGYTRDIMCARTIEVYEELLFPQITTATHDYEPMSVVA
jgi:glycosyltransferase involved in cell wall biosynthesis